MYPYSNNFANPYTQQFNPPFGTAPAQPKSEVVRVNGRNGAEAYQLPPNSSILLLDTSAPIVWLKTTDGAGYPTVQPYSISPFKEPGGTTQSLEERITRLEEIVNAESNNRSTKSKQSGVKNGEHETPN